MSTQKISSGQKVTGKNLQKGGKKKKVKNPFKVPESSIPKLVYKDSEFIVFEGNFGRIIPEEKLDAGEYFEGGEEITMVIFDIKKMSLHHFTKSNKKIFSLPLAEFEKLEPFIVLSDIFGTLLNSSKKQALQIIEQGAEKVLNQYEQFKKQQAKKMLDKYQKNSQQPSQLKALKRISNQLPQPEADHKED